MILRKLELLKFGYPLLISVSNKSFIGKLLNLENPEDRVYGSLVTEAGAININAIGVTAGDVTIDSGDDMTITAVGILSFNGAT